jgi:hypothetical protein
LIPQRKFPYNQFQPFFIPHSDTVIRLLKYF